jgi:hypothetical protein
MSLAAFAHDLVDRYAPDVDVPPPAVLDQVRRNAQLRASVLQEFGAVTAEELADLVGSRAVRRRTMVDNWVRADRVAAVGWRGQTLAPGFQLLTDGSPDPVLQPVLALLRKQGAQPWERALWWALPAPRLAGNRPVDVLLKSRSSTDRGEAQEALVVAAQRPRDWF